MYFNKEKDFLSHLPVKNVRKPYQITTKPLNANYNEWDSIFNDAVAANTILDRVLDHSKFITINEHSYRVKDYIQASE